MSDQPSSGAESQPAPPPAVDDESVRASAAPYANALQKAAAQLCFGRAPEGCSTECPNGWTGNARHPHPRLCGRAERAHGDSPEALAYRQRRDEPWVNRYTRRSL